MKEKRSHQPIVLTAVLFASVMLSGCATVKMHPDFNERHANMRRIAVLPSNVEAYEITFNAGNKPLAELKEYVKNRSTENLETIMKDKGYEIEMVAVNQERLDQEAELKEAWFDMQTLYEQAIKEIGQGKKKQFTYEVGAGPNYFAEHYNVNAILLARQRATKLSEGAIAAQVAKNAASIATTLLVGVSAGGGFQPFHTLDTEIAVIDAESGDILWYNLARTTENYTKPENTKVIMNHIKTIMNAFPVSKFKSSQADSSNTLKNQRPASATSAGATPTPPPPSVVNQ